MRGDISGFLNLTNDHWLFAGRDDDRGVILLSSSFPFFRLKMAENDAMTQMTAEKKFLEVKKNKKINAKGCHACHRHPVHTPKSMSAPAWLNPVPPKHELINRYRWTE